MSLSTTSELKSSDCDRWPALSRDQIEELLPGVKAWSVEGSEPPKLERKFKTKNFHSKICVHIRPCMSYIVHGTLYFVLLNT